MLLLVRPVGRYLERVFAGERTFLDPVMRPLERAIYRWAGVDPREEMDWKRYATAFLLFSLAGTLLLYVILRLQPVLHTFDPAFRPDPVAPDLAMNTAISFATTTTWQAYGGETTMSYFSQIVGLAAQNFLAGAAGLAVGIAFIRGLARERRRPLGNFWVDLVRAILWVLLPLCVVGSLVLVWQGVPLNFNPYQAVPLLQSTKAADGRPSRRRSCPGAGRGARVHQEPGHQRRRLLQCERRAPLREPDAADELARDAGHRGAAGRADPHLRADGRAPAPGLAAVRGHGRALRGGPRRV